MSQPALQTRKPSTEVSVIPGINDLSSRQLAKIRNTDDISIGKDIARSVAASGAAVGSGALVVCSYITGFAASNPVIWIPALMLGPMMIIITCFLASNACDVNGQTMSHLRIKRTDVDGIKAYYMTQDQLDTLKTQLSSVWDRVEKELAERPMEPLGMQLHVALSDYIADSAIVQNEIEELEYTAESIPNGEFRLRKQINDLRKARRIEAEKASEAINEAFKVHDDAVVEAAQISTRSLLESRGITIEG